ncbi:MAG: hypothetical protein KDA41_22510, partial [Planctomycetales bacterium]|nr:hypothetical protein [Planctomycetales bacterium]
MMEDNRSSRTRVPNAEGAARQLRALVVGHDLPAEIACAIEALRELAIVRTASTAAQGVDDLRSGGAAGEFRPDLT